MPDYTTYDFELLAAYIAGALDSEQSDKVKKQIASEPEFAELYRQLKAVSLAMPIENEFDTEAALFKTKQIINRGQKNTKLSYRFLFYAAAVAAIVFVSIVVARYYINSPSVNNELISYAAVDSVSSTLLADGSKVTLNQGSIIRYESEFNSRANREVILQGEAFFEVAHNTEKPFLVKASFADVRVTGTRFSVNNSTENEVIVWVEEGSVIVESNGKSIQLGSGEKALCSKHDGSISKLHGNGAESFWNNRKITFFATPLSTACETIEKAYNCNIEIDNENIGKLQITASFENEEPDHVLEIIALTLSLKLEKTDKQYRLYAE